jgi:hypothetical protein
MTTGTKTRLLGLTKELMVDWAATKESWRDAKSREFEQQYLNELTAAVNAAVTHLDALERVLEQIREDCE